MKTNNGFTLIEVMVVVAIVSILASIALPSYTEYVTRSRIPEATTNLLTKQVQLEQYFQDNRKYDGAPACNADSNDSFNFSCDNLTDTTFTLKAVGKDSMSDFTYTVDQAGKRATVSVPSGWTTSDTCWAIRKDGTC